MIIWVYLSSVYSVIVNGVKYILVAQTKSFKKADEISRHFES